VNIYIQIDILGKVEKNKIYIRSNKYLRRKRRREEKRGRRKRYLFLKNHNTTHGNGNGFFVAVCNK
jgi:hypothetical protein